MSSGAESIDITVPTEGNYTIHAWLEKRPGDGGAPVIQGEDTQGPIPVTELCEGVIIIDPTPIPIDPTPIPQLAETVAEAAGSGDTPDAQGKAIAVAAVEAAIRAAQGPVIFQGTFPSIPTNPILAMIWQIYRVKPPAGPYCPSTEFVEFIAPAQLVGNTFSVVFPAKARKKNRHYRYFLVRALGHFTAGSGPVPKT